MKKSELEANRVGRGGVIAMDTTPREGESELDAMNRATRELYELWGPVEERGIKEGFAVTWKEGRALVDSGVDLVPMFSCRGMWFPQYAPDYTRGPSEYEAPDVD